MQFNAHRRLAIAVVSALLVGVGAVPSLAHVRAAKPSAAAAVGDGTILRTVTAQNYDCAVGTGIAFDGTNLLLSCDDSNLVTAVSPVDGSFVRSYTIAGIPAIGALSWDHARNIMWACGGFGGDDSIVYQIDLQTQVATEAFGGTEGCPDGLAYDGSDDTLFVSADVATTVQHYRTDGTLIANIDVSTQLGNCGNSGLAVAGSQLLLSNDGCSQIYIANKSVTNATLFGTYPSRLEDMECDDSTFASANQAAIWSKDAYDGVLNAFDLGSVDCGLNGYRDSDGDGISDDWETNGVDFNGDGKIDLDLAAMGANPRRKDVFAEIDWLTKDARKVGPISLGGGYNEQPSVAAADRVEQAFAAWPVPNPDGSQGINLHLDAGPTSIMNPVTGATWGSKSRANAIKNGIDLQDWSSWTQMDTYRQSNVDAARRGVFHYIIFGNNYSCENGSCVTGKSRGIPGHDLFIARGAIDTQLQEAVTVAHELGHNLGLGHGGRERSDDPGSQGVNNKANYLSIMNYYYSNTGLVSNSGADGIITYSSQELDPLATTNLPEASGLTPDPFAHLRVVYRCPNGKLAKADAWASIDWNCDGTIANGSANSNLQKADDVASLKVNPDLVLGSEDFHHLYFWGTGGAFDARNASIVDFDQPGTQEPSVAQAKADGVWYPQASLVVPPTPEVTAYPNTGSVAIPLTLSNPGAAAVAATATLSGSPALGLSDGAVQLSPGSQAVLTLTLATQNLKPGQDVTGTIGYANPTYGQLAQSALTIHVADAAAPSACADAQAARNAADGNPSQLPLLDAFLKTCVASGPPVANADTATTNEDTSVRIAVLANDVNPSGHALTVGSSTQPSHGLVACDSTSCTYKPAKNYNGPDSFTYLATDGSASSQAARVNVIVKPVNDAPVAVDDHLTVRAGSGASAVSVLLNDTDIDGDGLHLAAAKLIGPGSVSIGGGQVVYTPPSRIAQPTEATVAYTISDGHGGVASADVHIMVTGAALQLQVRSAVIAGGKYAHIEGSFAAPPGGVIACGDAITVGLAGQEITIPGKASHRGSLGGHCHYGKDCLSAVYTPNSSLVVTLDLRRGSYTISAALAKPISLHGKTDVVPFTLTLDNFTGSAPLRLRNYGHGLWVGR